MRTQALAPLAIFVLSTALLSGCSGDGGGDGGGQAGAAPVGTDTPQSICPAGAAFAVDADSTAEAGQSVGAVLIGCSITPKSVNWTQTAGPSVLLLSNRTQAIGFDPQEAGVYAFQVTFTDDSGAPHAASVTIQVTPAVTATRINARIDQAVRMGGRASIHLWDSIAPGDAVKAITWEQTAGPQATIDVSDPRRLLLTAPRVSRDEMLAFRATLQTANGAIATDDVRVVVEKFDQANVTDSAAVFRSIHLSRVYPYRSSSPYAGTLVQCTFHPSLRYASPSDHSLCPLSRLPLLAQMPSNGTPTIDEIMDRVVVSHDWMGQTFEEFLRTQDTFGDIRRMLASTTAIVIGAFIRPAFYHAATAAIYLDARDLWISPEQRDSVNEHPDPRSTFDDLLRYANITFYSSNNTPLSAAPPVQLRLTRGLSILRGVLGRLLYHELTHALDFNAPRFYNSLDPSKNPFDNQVPRSGERPSALLTALAPLASNELRGLAQVKAGARLPTTIETQYTPAQVGAFFSADRASDEYSFTSPREDAAMLIEEFFMVHRLGLRRNVAFIDQFSSTESPFSLPVRWGQRGRIGDPTISPRVRYLLEQMTPWIDASAVNALPAPISMRQGETLQQNFVLP